MVLNVNWQAEAENALSQMTTPPILRVRVQQPPARPDYDLSKGSIQQIATRILQREQAKINQWVLAQRQNARMSQLPQWRKRGKFRNVEAMFTRAHRTEQVDVVVYPVPPTKNPDDELQLLILHNTHEITAVPMAMLGSDKPWSPTLQKPLRGSDWGEDLIMTSQYKFDTIMGVTLLSRIAVEKNTLVKKDYLQLCPGLSKLRDFLETQTLAARTPRFNAADGTYYTPNDVFVTEKSNQGVKLVRDSAGGNEAFPYAIAADGTYYYAPSSTSLGEGSLLSGGPKLYSTDPFEQHATTEIWAEVFANTALDGVHLGNVKLPAAGKMLDETFEFYTDSHMDISLDYFTKGATRYVGPRFGYVAPIDLQLTTLVWVFEPFVPSTTTLNVSEFGSIWLNENLEWTGIPLGEKDDGTSTLLYFGDPHTVGTTTVYSPPPIATVVRYSSGGLTLEHDADTGYGTWTQGDGYTVSYNRQDITFPYRGPITHLTTKPDYGKEIPFTVFKQERDSSPNKTWLDVLEVAFPTITASIDNFDLASIGGNIIDENFEFLHYKFHRHLEQSTVAPFNTIITGDRGEDGGYLHSTYVWLVSYPPSFSVTAGDYYFFDKAVLHTPYNDTETTIQPTEFSFPTLEMWKKYLPWCHLSNGKVVIQAYQLLKERWVWYRGRDAKDIEAEPREITTQLEDVTKASVKDIQALIIDVPLARIKEFV